MSRFREIQTAYVVVGRGNSDFDPEPRILSLALDLGQTKTRTHTSIELGMSIVLMYMVLTILYQTIDEGGSRLDGRFKMTLHPADTLESHRAGMLPFLRRR